MRIGQIVEDVEALSLLNVGVELIGESVPLIGAQKSFTFLEKLALGIAMSPTA